MDLDTYHSLYQRGQNALKDWENQWPEVRVDDTLAVDPTVVEKAVTQLTQRLTDNYPFFHPQYAGQMLKPPHPVAMLGYMLAMQINPNNHALDGGPATSKMEKECVEALGRFFGLPNCLGHLTGGGTMANLEALWVAKQLHPDRFIVFSEEAHYTHKRMCDLIGADYVQIPATYKGKMDLDALKPLLEDGQTGTVVATLGTTSLGALEPLEELVALKEKYKFRIHLDTAYGGFYRALAESDPDLSAFTWTKDCNSIVVDPHKHGLQPYGCGCVLFADPGVGQVYQHDSPYTYFTSDELHLGEISLECSRPGAAAAALWLTLQCFPLEAERGFGPILKKTRQAALTMAQALEASAQLTLLHPPELDIVTFFPTGERVSEINQRTEQLFTTAMTAEPEATVYLAKLTIPSARLRALHPDITQDAESLTVLRSCLMKPEHLTTATSIVGQLISLVNP
ncbi:MAG: aminotransferase class I/II-fold pyridoxal phosphate-dependent enzyme [Vampirovibrio sp.]|nr:aminotransferase class I/II-fold pyridoxal phosphate-dependent enzyme [Vampirovibrio sp.]